MFKKLTSIVAVLTSITSASIFAAYASTDKNTTADVSSYYAYPTPKPPLSERASETLSLWQGFYVSAKMSLMNSKLSNISLLNQNPNEENAQLASKSQSKNLTSPTLALGFAFSTWNDWGFPSRAEIEYTYLGSQSYNPNPAFTFPDPQVLPSINADVKNQVVLLNVYHDFDGIWDHFIPYVGGGGIGFDFNKVNATSVFPGDQSSPASSVATNTSKTNLAWDVRAGLKIKVTPALSLDASYQYMELGKTNPINLAGPGFENLQVGIDKMKINGLMLGLTWQFL